MKLKVDAKSILSSFKKKNDAQLKSYFARETKRASKISAFDEEFITNLADFTADGGKRLRASLLYYVYKMTGGEDEAAILKVSPFIELFHSALLIHDDIMDESPLRHNKPTFHALYKNTHKEKYNKGEPDHFGVTMGINGGDMLIGMTFEHLANSKFPIQNRTKAISLLAHHLVAVVHGQVHDILNQVMDEVCEEDILDVHLWKTAKYTYECPMHIGAALAGATDSQLKTISQYAIPSGIAFQIQDDIIDLYSDHEDLGKTRGGDIKEGKQTLLIQKALEWGDIEDIKVLTRSLGNKNIGEKEIEQVREIVRKTGSLDYSKNLALKYVKQAQKALKKMEWANGGRAYLEAIAEYMINRQF
jgi:geranylgeranyl diphosphate synthase, type I